MSESTDRRESLEQQVNNPSHYGGQDNVYEAIKVIEAWQVGFCLGNTLKYISRAGQKPGESEIKDLKKAEWYLRRRIEQLEKWASEPVRYTIAYPNMGMLVASDPDLNPGFSNAK